MFRFFFLFKPGIRRGAGPVFSGNLWGDERPRSLELGSFFFPSARRMDDQERHDMEQAVIHARQSEQIYFLEKKQKAKFYFQDFFQETKKFCLLLKDF